jgi:chromosome segregation ATPase
VIESIMIFALGFLAAGLCALLVLPALHARAERLARRRVEALFPLSIAELTAEKDHLRAEFAVVQRRLERRVDEALAGKHADMEEMGRRAVRIERLTQDVEERDARIAALGDELARTQETLAETETRLAGMERDAQAAGATLAALEAAHGAMLGEMGVQREALRALEATHAGLQRTTEAASAREAALRAEHDLLRTRHADALSESDVRRITVSDLETRLLAQTTRSDDYARQLAQAREGRAEGAAGSPPAGAPDPAETAELRRMIVEVADRIMERGGAQAGQP